MVRFPDITVTTIQRHQTNRLIAGGVLESGPFTAVSLSLGGFVEGTPSEPATIGAVLVPGGKAPHLIRREHLSMMKTNHHLIFFVHR